MTSADDERQQRVDEEAAEQGDLDHSDASPPEVVARRVAARATADDDLGTGDRPPEHRE